MSKIQEDANVEALPTNDQEQADEQAIEIHNPVFERDGRYWKVIKPATKDKEAQIDEISSFVIDPQETLWIPETDTQVIRCRIRSGNKTCKCSIEKSAFDSRSKFLKALPNYNMTWLGSDKDTQYLMNLLAREDIPSKTGTTKLGYHDDLWVVGDRGIDKNGWVEDPQLIYHPMGGKSVTQENLDYRHLSDEEYADLVKGVYEHLPFINKPEVIYSNIGWTFATPFKPLIMKKIGHFPLKNVYGTTGSGKSSTELLLWELFGGKPMSHLSSCKQTEFDFLYLLSSTSSIPLIFNEYKYGKLNQTDIARIQYYATCVYDGKVEHRGKPELYLVGYKLTAPMGIVGEISLSESALLERVIPINPNRNTLQESDFQRHFDTLRALPLNGFIDRYIQYVYQVDFDSAWNQAVEETQRTMNQEGIKVPYRVAHNMTVVVFGITQFFFFGLEYDCYAHNYLEMHQGVFKEISRILAPKGNGRRLSLAVDTFMEEIAVMIETDELRGGTHYKITENELYLNFPTCYRAFKRHLRLSGSEDEETLDKKGYRDQFNELKESGSYVTEINESKWFGTSTKRAIVIDLDKLKSTLGVDLSGRG